MRVWLFFLLMLGMVPAWADEVPVTKAGGVYHVSGTVNDKVTVTFVVDSGAADVVLPQSAIDQLNQQGALSSADKLQDGIAVTADGSRVRTPRYTLHHVTVGGVTVDNVEAAVVSSRGEALLGQAFLSRLPYWSLETNKNLLVVGSADSHVADTAHLFSAATAQDLNTRIDSIKKHTGKEVLIATTPSFGGDTSDAIAAHFTHGRTISGLLILISVGEKSTQIKVGDASKDRFPPTVVLEVKKAMNDQFRQQHYDDGIKAGMLLIEQHFGKKVSANQGSLVARLR